MFQEATTLEGVNVLTAIEGIFRDGQVELLEQPDEGLQEARVIVTFLPLTPGKEAAQEARHRMLARMRSGIPLGGPPYPKREEIYDQRPQGVNRLRGIPDSRGAY